MVLHFHRAASNTFNVIISFSMSPQNKRLEQVMENWNSANGTVMVTQQ
jgi:hypothetical protein